MADKNTTSNTVSYTHLFDCYSVNARFVSPIIIIALKACVVSLFPFLSLIHICLHAW